MHDISIKLAKKKRRNFTFEDDEDQADISQREKCFLPIMLEDIGQRHPVDDSDGDLAYNPGLDDLGGEPFCKCQEKKE